MDFPILFISALTKQRILKVLETAKAVYDNRRRRVPTRKLNETMLPIIKVRRVKRYKAGFVANDSSIGPDETLADILSLQKKTEHTTVAVMPWPMADR